MRPIERLDKLGIINEFLIAVHCTQLIDDEITLFAKKGVSVVHCPESNCKLVSGICPVNKLEKNGVNVCLGTDGVSANNDMDMFGEMRTASFLGKVSTLDHSANNSYTILKMATINGAKAMKLDHKIGTLEIGKSADLLILNLNTLHTQPVYDPMNVIVFSCGRENIEDVMVEGKFLLMKKQLLTVDENYAIEVVKQWSKKVDSESY